MNQEAYSQAKADLVEMFRSPGWSTTRELLKFRLRAIEWRVATDFRMEPDGWRHEQEEHALIRALIENPLDFILAGVKVAETKDD